MPATAKEAKHEQEAQRERALEVCRNLFPEGARVATVTVHGRGSTDYVEVFASHAADYSSPHPYVDRVTYHVARAIGFFGSLERGIPKRGYQYDKAHDVVDSLSRALYGEGGKLHRDSVLTVRGR